MLTSEQPREQIRAMTVRRLQAQLQELCRRGFAEDVVNVTFEGTAVDRIVMDMVAGPDGVTLETSRVR